MRLQVLQFDVLRAFYCGSGMSPLPMAARALAVLSMWRAGRQLSRAQATAAEAARAGGPDRRGDPWAGRTRLALAVIVILGAVLRIASLPSVQSRTPDERSYTTAARVVLFEGFSGVRRLTAEYVRDQQRLYSPPSRIGYSAVSALVMRLSGRFDERAGAWVSCAASIATLGAVGVLGLRVLNAPAALFGTLLLAVFPPRSRCGAPRVD